MAPAIAPVSNWHKNEEVPNSQIQPVTEPHVRESGLGAALDSMTRVESKAKLIQPNSYRQQLSVGWLSRTELIHDAV